MVYLIHKTFHEGIYPEVLKVKKVIPLHKSGALTKIDKYRPITLVSCLSKLIELIKKRIMKFISKEVGFDDYQYGFYENSSTLSTTDFDKIVYVLTVFVDLGKAFDVVDHKILLNNLEKMGIKGNLLTLLSTHLSNREQYVYLNGDYSDDRHSNYRVPQGSALGPFMYTLMVRSLECEQ